MPQNVLVVEDEGAGQSSIAQGLKELPKVDVSECSNTDEALEELDREAPDLIILDVKLHDTSRLKLLQRVAAYTSPIPIIVTTAHRSAYKQQLERLQELTVLEKPVSPQRLRQTVQDILSTRATKKHSLFQVVDYLQLAGLSRHSLVLDVELETGERGSIEMVDGEIWNVFLGGSTGEPALERLIVSRASRVETRPLKQTPARAQMRKQPESVLIETAQRIDAARHSLFQGARASPLAPGPLACELGLWTCDDACGEDSPLQTQLDGVRAP